MPSNSPPPRLSLPQWQYTKAGVCLHVVLGIVCVWLCIYLWIWKIVLILCGCVFIYLFSYMCVCACSRRLENIWWESSRGGLISKNTVCYCVGVDCEELEGKDGARGKRGEEEKQIVLKQTCKKKKKSPLSPRGLMSLQAWAVRFISRQAEGGESSSAELLFLVRPKQQCNRQLAEHHRQVVMFWLPVGFIFSQPCYVWQMSSAVKLVREMWEYRMGTKADNGCEDCSSLLWLKAAPDELSNRMAVYWYGKTTHAHTHSHLFTCSAHSSSHKTLYST